MGKMKLQILIILTYTIYVQSISSDLISFVSSKENTIIQMGKKVQTLFQQRCTYNCSCSLAACRSELRDISTCDYDRGSSALCSTDGTGSCNGKLSSKSTSTVRVANGIDFLSEKQQTEVCWTSGLDDLFKNYSSDPTITWFYFATQEGVMRGYPGTSRCDCTSYDPRNRPWYVSASSGPKDVILIIDISGSMAGERLDLAKLAAVSILGSLSFNDYVAVISFSTSSKILNSQTSLTRATASVVSKLKSSVNKLNVEGGTNYQSAFDNAFDLLNKGGGTGCSSVILFLTDGDPNVGYLGNQLTTYIKGRNTMNVKIFSYTLGSGVSEEIPKKLACDSEGNSDCIFCDSTRFYEKDRLVFFRDL
eukprot:TRINITY_DN4580_c0_g1_i2.p1 TRINITY_DN4580_c0_g1~~TRINITY_DN4580_c0_g1_i2.p1  ORF type:complete len:363 (-),score=51.70 TRINITY_DN4580_c0_g1_i2:634-1722(-)